MFAKFSNVLIAKIDLAEGGETNRPPYALYFPFFKNKKIYKYTALRYCPSCVYPGSHWQSFAESLFGYQPSLCLFLDN